MESARVTNRGVTKIKKLLTLAAIFTLVFTACEEEYG